MIICDQNVMCICIGPLEHDPVLIVHPDAVGAAPPPFQRFQAVTGRHTKVSQVMSCIQQIKFAYNDGPNDLRNAPRSLGVYAVKQVLCCTVAETQDHKRMYGFNDICARRWGRFIEREVHGTGQGHNEPGMLPISDLDHSQSAHSEIDGRRLVEGEVMVCSYDHEPSEIDGRARWRRWRVFRFQPRDSTLVAEIDSMCGESHRCVSISESSLWVLSLPKRKYH